MDVTGEGVANAAGPSLVFSIERLQRAQVVRIKI
jgi:hypothetical protein